MVQNSFPNPPREIILKCETSNFRTEQVHMARIQSREDFCASLPTDPDNRSPSEQSDQESHQDTRLYDDLSVSESTDDNVSEPRSQASSIDSIELNAIQRYFHSRRV